MDSISTLHIPLKRFFDLVFSILVLIIGFPVFFLIGLLIKLTSKGPIIYGHERIGRGGKPFYCYKFRTMHKDADQRLKKLLRTSPQMREEWEKTYKLKNDPRITPIGKFLRKTSLDELPQFWNVIKGDLSIVGPRPVIKQELDKHFGAKAPKILSIRPGLTGLWQVSGRSDTCYTKRIQLDERYVEAAERGSYPFRVDLLALDIKVIAKTIPSMIFSKGAY